MKRMYLLRDLIKQSTIVKTITPFVNRPELGNISFTVRNLTAADMRVVVTSPRLLRSKMEGNQELYNIDKKIEELAMAILAINEVPVEPAQVVGELRKQDWEIVNFLYKICRIDIAAEITSELFDAVRSDDLLKK
jgi:hypothetical protein